MTLCAVVLAVASLWGMVAGQPADSPTLRACQVERVLASPEWQTVLRNRNAHDLAEHRAAISNHAGVVPADPVEASDEAVVVAAEYHSPAAPPGLIEWRPEVEQWRPLVARYFHPEDIDHALAIIRCESVGDPDAHNPAGPVSGLFQHRDNYWQERSALAGWPGADIYNPDANTAVAAWLVYDNGGWSHWSGAAWGVASCQEYAEAQGVG